MTVVKKIQICCHIADNHIVQNVSVCACDCQDQLHSVLHAAFQAIIVQYSSREVCITTSTVCSGYMNL